MLFIAAILTISPRSVCYVLCGVCRASLSERLVAEREAAGRTPMVPSLYLRRDRPAPGTVVAASAAAAATGTQKGGGAAAGGGMLDAREFMEEIDLVKRIKATEFATLVVWCGGVVCGVVVSVVCVRHLCVCVMCDVM